MDDFMSVFILPDGTIIPAPDIETIGTYVWLQDTPYRIIDVTDDNEMRVEEIEYE